MDAFAQAQTKLLHGLVVFSGRRPRDFRLQPSGLRVQVFGRQRIASYPREGWTSPLMRDLYQGYFDARNPLSMP